MKKLKKIGRMKKMYEGVTLDNGLTVKNGVIQNVANFDAEALKKKVEALQVPQPWTIARRKAVEDAKNKKRR